MSLAHAARLARREIRGGLRGFTVFLACLALGVATIAAIGSVRAAIEAGLASEGAALLGGDAEMSFTYRMANDDERAWMQENALTASEIVDFRSMAVVPRGDDAERALTQVKAIDSAYPLVGTVQLDPPIPLPEAMAGQDTLPGAVMQGLLVDRVGLEIGDTFKLGQQEFVLMARLMREPDSSGGFGLAPRTIVTTKALETSGLLAPGTLFTSHYRLSLPENPDLATLEEDARARFETTGLRWRDSRNGAPGLARFVDRFGAFLILVGLAGLAVGGVGVSTAIRAWLARKTEIIAILRSLGATRQTIFLTYFLQIGMVATVGIALGLLIGALTPILLAPLILAVLPFPAVFTLYPLPLIEAALYGALTAAIFTLWPLARIEDVRPTALFRDALDARANLPAPRYLLAVALLLVLLVALAAWLSGSTTLTLWFAAGVVAAMGFLSLAALALRALVRVLSKRTRPTPALSWALNAIARSREATTPVVLSLGLGLSVLATVGQVDGNLRNAIARDLPDVAPSFFFVDIQKDQMPDFSARLDANASVSKVESAPMLRGIITRINGKPAREVAGDHWVIRGDRGVTYSAALPQNTKLTAGTWWPADYTGNPQISFAAEEAFEMGVQLGDTMTVNILGRDITATVTSFREVDFSTAGMGFVIAMNPTALAGAPHSFIATVYAEEAAEAPLLRELANAFPNITAIHVREAVGRVSDLVAQLANATTYGAAAILLTGLLVIIGAAAAGQQGRLYEAAILKTIGALRRQILTSFALRAALLGTSAGLVALAVGLTGAWAVMTFVMESDFEVIWSNAITVVLAGLLANLLAGMLFALPSLGIRPARILRARD
ncbi:ABC transporter permease [Shimia aestuarii]|uniref:Putative ABC transport system permease protein n=1 Tax=Shimia aestuarii TaxID=254406 RepID=A0A1I4HP49_9RHOB|nr:FtsX-like permease family protein [Shimia aestuarii]SFL43331.1 putative ABC transport system permease protein [Shimia aestuarii]